MADLKKPPFKKLNPSGRIPVIEDPTTGVTPWESGEAVAALSDEWTRTILGQAAWVEKFHPEKIAGTQNRYKDQIKRVSQVLDKHLKATGKEYLVGDECTYADLSFVTWDILIPWIFGDEAEGLQIEKNYPSYYTWNQRLMQRASHQKISQDKQKAMSGK
ncbi:hypothetical protein N431DRAFT_489575 [Stipitochalara longipes BDJ]|nr:hypothetical protein N431DRAFT_489575 [Stipitochalara longipes BDJ]